MQQAQETLYEAYKKKQIKPVIWKTYPMAQLVEAMDAMERRECYGKVILGA